MAKKKKEEIISIPIVGSIGDEIETIPIPSNAKESSKLIEFIAKDNEGKYEKSFEIDSVKPVPGEVDMVSVLVFFDDKSFARRYVLNKSYVE